MGVRFVEPPSEGMDLQQAPPRRHNGGANRGSASRAPLVSDSASPSLSPQLRYSDVRSGSYRSPIRPSFFALAFLLLLLVASATFYIAGVYAAGVEPVDDTSWAVEVCDRARNFCEHPEWSAIPAVLMAIVFLAVKGMEL